MKPFMDEHFLLSNEISEKLYAEVKDLPIIDYHCHIDAGEIYENKRFSTITEAWLGGDHYKWRAMRNMGVEERLITGDAPDYDKFVAWATILPYMAGHPLYHFSHLELKRYLGIDEPLSAGTAPSIYARANEALASLPVREIIKRANVETIVTTNDPTENLKYHKLLKNSGCSATVYPAFRPDKALNIEKAGFKEYIPSLAASANTEIKNYSDLKAALLSRLDAFKAAGCPASDHGLDYVPCSFAARPEAVFEKAMNGEPLSTAEADSYKTDLLLALAAEYNRCGMVMEIHFGAVRNVNSQMFTRLGADSGFDCMRGETKADNLYPLLNAMLGNGLPKTLLFSLNPNDNDLLVTLMGGFNSAPTAGRVQQGAAWWFNDTEGGIKRQLATFASGAPISTFIGMLTDSRSFLSYARHEYFRRILSDFLGSLAFRGAYPLSDLPALLDTARKISYFNAKSYFEFN